MTLNCNENMKAFQREPAPNSKLYHCPVRFVHFIALLLSALVNSINCKGLVGKLPGNPASCPEEPCNSDPQHVLYALKWTSLGFFCTLLLPVLLYFLSKLMSKIHSICYGGGNGEKGELEREKTSEDLIYDVSHADANYSVDDQPLNVAELELAPTIIENSFDDKQIKQQHPLKRASLYQIDQQSNKVNDHLNNLVEQNLQLVHMVATRGDQNNFNHNNEQSTNRSSFKKDNKKLPGSGKRVSKANIQLPYQHKVYPTSPEMAHQNDYQQPILDYQSLKSPASLAMQQQQFVYNNYQQNNSSSLNSSPKPLNSQSQQQHTPTPQLSMINQLYHQELAASNNILALPPQGQLHRHSIDGSILNGMVHSMQGGEEQTSKVNGYQPTPRKDKRRGSRANGNAKHHQNKRLSVVRCNQNQMLIAQDGEGLLKLQLQQPMFQRQHQQIDNRRPSLNVFSESHLLQYSPEESRHKL